jgi:hypothetical protein
MDSNGKFWFNLWGSILLTIVVIVTSSLLYSNGIYDSKHNTILQAVKSGGDPVKTACALELLENPNVNSIKLYCLSLNKE